MTIDIDRLTEAELIALNRRIVERLRLLQRDRVAFQADGPGTVVGVLTRYNRKSVTVITDDGHQWNVAPGLSPGLPLPPLPSPGPVLAWST